VRPAEAYARFMESFLVKANFERQMVSVQAVMNATADDMAALRKAALANYPADRAAEAQEVLAKGGAGVADILGGALAGVLHLADRTDLDASGSAEVVATVMNTFQMPGTDVPAAVASMLTAAGELPVDFSTFWESLRRTALPAALTDRTLDDAVRILVVVLKVAPTQRVECSLGRAGQMVFFEGEGGRILATVPAGEATVQVRVR
jgi:TP901 family phage tail tape measure protein